MQESEELSVDSVSLTVFLGIKRMFYFSVSSFFNVYFIFSFFISCGAFKSTSDILGMLLQISLCCIHFFYFILFHPEI